MQVSEASTCTLSRSPCAGSKSQRQLRVNGGVHVVMMMGIVIRKVMMVIKTVAMIIRILLVTIAVDVIMIHNGGRNIIVVAAQMTVCIMWRTIVITIKMQIAANTSTRRY